MMGYLTNTFYRSFQSIPKLQKDRLIKKIWGVQKDLSNEKFHSVYLFYITKINKKGELKERFLKLGRTADLNSTTKRIETAFSEYDGYQINCLYWGLDNNPPRKWVLFHADIIEKRLNETLQLNGYDLARIPRKFPKELFRLKNEQSEIVAKGFVKDFIDFLDTSKEIKTYGQLARKDFKLKRVEDV
tara:strand:- start:281 stop:841 length:561 start_codon:yes stop_codon:yes gene_type:complete